MPESIEARVETLQEISLKYGCKFLINEPLKEHTSFKIGGPCDIMIFPNSIDSLKELISVADRYMILGNGSNVLFSDNGYRGAIFVLGPDISEVTVDGEYITAYAGASLARVCKTALDSSLTGLEFAYGIPGTVGGAVFMNAGAYGGEMKDVVAEVTCINQSGEIVTYSSDNLDFGYRSSRFTLSNEIIVSAKFRLSTGDKDVIKARMDELIARRKSRQPLEYPSAGSTFKRPEGTYAGLVIEESGLKGYSVGGAKVSDKHANFVINTGDATAADVMKLISRIKKTVSQKTGYKLECEVKLIEE
ncbi:MAG: UDP-N-acetylmuramate dehydrogenase [Oscillospiraceae bacterium]|nr:UDP-N-acetylmuramate dehydrogenase [Oscillospiraceae bacterium]